MRDLSDFGDRPYRFILHSLNRCRRSHLVIALAVAGAVTCSVSAQYGVKKLVDALSMPSLHDGVWPAFSLLIMLITADNLLWRFAAWNGHSAFVNVSGGVRRDLFKHLTGHAPSYFQAQSAGALTSRITATSNALYLAETMVTFNAMPPLFATLVSIVYLATVSTEMAAALTGIAAVVVFVMFHWAARGTDLHHAYAREAAKVDGEMIDIVSNITIVKSFGRLRSEHSRLSGTLAREMRARRSSLYYLERLRVFHAITTAALTFGLLAWAISLWKAKQATAGDVVLVCTLGLSILSATRDLAVALVDVTQHLARLSEALRTLLVPHASSKRATGPIDVQPDNAIEFRRVGFSYPDGKPVFSDLDFGIRRGERVGIVGPSGSGKSTIFALTQRFFEAQQGAITIDGQSTGEMPDETLRKSIAVVPQDLTLFHRTLRENIRYGRPGASDEEILAAAGAARCLGFIEQLPDGLDTIVGERGARLSGGQRQRIAIARAFLKDAPILLLDEATSALDSLSEDLIREALKSLMAGRTVLAIAHRLSTLRNFDRIMVIQDGEIVEDGPPEALMRKRGAYKSLVDLEFSRIRSLSVAA